MVPPPISQVQPLLPRSAAGLALISLFVESSGDNGLEWIGNVTVGMLNKYN